jgi:hypothetical protein
MPEKEVPKGTLLNRIEKEKKAFLNLVMSIELPPAPGRLAIPCLRTADKALLESSNMDSLQQFFAEEIEVVKGHIIEFDTFYNSFIEWLPYEERSTWTKIKVARRYPRETPHCKGKWAKDNITYCGNIRIKRNPDAGEKHTGYWYQDINSRLNIRS